MNLVVRLLMSLPLIAFMLAVISSPSAGRATFPGSSGRIAYTWGGATDGQFNYEIFTINPDGTGTTNLTNSPSTSEFSPAWSPDGRQIAFDRGNDIWMMDANGCNARQLTSTLEVELDPAWSPDGIEIVFQQLTGSAGIYVMPLDGIGARLVAGGLVTLGHDGGPDWSSDGAQIIYSSYGELILVKPDGTGGTKLTQGQTGAAPSWSPDGQYVAFLGHVGGHLDVFVSSRDGLNVINLSPDITNEDSVTWSPDGSQLAFISHRDGDQDLYLMDPDGTRVGQLIDTPEAELFPDWQPLTGAEIPSGPCVEQAEATPAAAVPAGGGRPSNSSDRASAALFVAGLAFFGASVATLAWARRSFRG